VKTNQGDRTKRTPQKTEKTTQENGKELTTIGSEESVYKEITHNRLLPTAR